MTKEEIIKLYINDLKNLVGQSTARDARIETLSEELKYIDKEDDIVKTAIHNVTNTLQKRGWTEESKRLHSDICCDILNAKTEHDNS